MPRRPSRTPGHRLQQIHPATAQVVIAGHAFVQNLRRGHYEIHHGIREYLSFPPIRDAVVPHFG
jgi:hypothetical protein